MQTGLWQVYGNCTRTQCPEPGITSGSLVVIGGINGKHESLKTVDVYHLNAGSITWSHEAQQSPFVYTRMCKVVDNNNVYILGESTYNRYYPNRNRSQFGTARYRIEDDSWELLPSLTWGPFIGFNNPVMFVQQDILYMSTNDETWALEQITHANHDLSSDLAQTQHELPSRGWAQRNTKLPFPVFCPNCVTSVGDRVFIIGTVGNRFQSRVVSLRPGEQWRSVSPVKEARDPLRICAVSDDEDQIWVVGGCVLCRSTGFIEHYRVSTDTWTTLSAFPDLTFSNTLGIYAQICGYHDGYIYAIFSFRWRSGLDRRFHIFNTRDNTWSVSQTELRTEAYQS